MQDCQAPLQLQNWKLDDETGTLAQRIIDNWLVGLRQTNPAILDMFYDRDIQPYRDMLPWSGEFAGKYLTSAYYIYQITRSEKLYDYIQTFIGELLGLLDEDGYLGCYQKACHLTGAYSQNPAESGATWDAWAHYHTMYGLYQWYRQTGDKHQLAAVLRIAELFLGTFYNGRRRLCEIGWTETNFSPMHIFTILYRETGDHRYLDFALEIEKDLTADNAGDYIRCSQRGLEFYQCPKPRWESLHTIMGIAELYRCTGNRKYLDAAAQIFYSILTHDVHNTGAFSTDEAALGEPFRNGSIEICCVVAFNALACELLKLTGDIRIADFLEISLYNAVMGSFSPTGRWSTYNTPMDGVKCANFHHINFQSRPGSPELNCCSVNAPRGVGNLSEWAYTEDSNTLYIHYFGQSSFATTDGVRMEITGAYPADNTVTLRAIAPPAGKSIAVRIPSWSKNTRLLRGGEAQQVQAGTYWRWEHPKADEEITIAFDFTLRLLAGGGEYADKKSLYRGPVLFGFDASLNPEADIDDLPPIPHAALDGAVVQKQPENGRFPGYLLMRTKHGLVLADFRHLGMTGSRYKTWLAVDKA